LSQANVDAVRGQLERDGPDFASALADLSDSVVWIVAKEHPNARTLRGRAEVVAYLEEWAVMFDDFRFEVDEYRDAGNRVIAFGTSRGTGKGGGVPVEVPLALVYTFEGGQVVRVEEFLDRDQALTAARAAR
jgi:ketosteroid isomerase-like protein